MAYIKNAETYSTGPTMKWTITYSASRSGANVNYSISVSMASLLYIIRIIFLDGFTFIVPIVYNH